MQVQGHAQDMVINSHKDQMLFMADGEEAVVGTGKLHVLGTRTPRAPLIIGQGR